ncbi:alpha/beta hydrolase, partial [Aeromicrobium sp.]|nr:alpha/beta hydrolase [Candidatus Saccharibacteria bacterium]
NYTDTGSGPVVVLLHGYMASSQYWERLATRLSKTNRVIALDLLGFGGSPKPVTSRYDYDTQLRSIDATLRYLGVRGKFSLVGHSMGSLLALRFASVYPERVRKLTLSNMPIFLSRREAKRDIMGGNLLYQIGLRRGLHDIIWPILSLALRFRLIPLKIAGETATRKSFIFQNTSSSRLRSMRNVIFAVGIEADLLRIDMKTTLITGLQDRKQYLLNLPKLRQAKNIVSHVVQGGHHTPLTHPELLQQFVV